MTAGRAHARLATPESLLPPGASGGGMGGRGGGGQIPPRPLVATHPEIKTNACHLVSVVAPVGTGICDEGDHRMTSARRNRRRPIVRRGLAAAATVAALA